MGLKALERDLRNGMSVEDGLRKHGLTLKQIFNSHMTSRVIPETFKKGSISKTRSGKFQLNKIINGKYHYCGTYATREDAEVIREELDEAKWDFNQLDSILERTGIRKYTHRDKRLHSNDSLIYQSSSGSYFVQKRYCKNGKTVKRVHGGTYHSIEEARLVRDKLIECNWDIGQLDKICNELGVTRHTRGRGK